MGLNKQQKKAMMLMKSGVNVILFGDAGTGKSYTINAFLASLDAKDRDKTIVMAPTGIAARNVDGYTIHRSLKLSIDPFGPFKEPPEKIPEVLTTANRIIIDEISMVRFDLLNYVIKCIKAAENTLNKRIQIILVGDFHQLPPVLNDKDLGLLYQLWNKGHVPDFFMAEAKKKGKKTKEYYHVRKLIEEVFIGGYAFQSPLWSDLSLEYVYLEKQYRQEGDTAYTKALNSLRCAFTIDEKKECAKYFNGINNKENDGIYICPTNKKANKKNEAKINELVDKGQQRVIYAAEIRGDVSDTDKPLVEDRIELCKGARVMSVINDREKDGVINGAMGTVIALNEVMARVEFDSGQIHEITPYEWKVTEPYVRTLPDKTKRIERREIGSYKQIPLRVAYAITVHKSQGMTFEKANIGTGFFAAGQAYVAFSRVKSASGVHVIGHLDQSDIITSAAVKKYYDTNGMECSTIYPGPEYPCEEEEAEEETEIVEEHDDQDEPAAPTFPEEEASKLIETDFDETAADVPLSRLTEIEEKIIQLIASNRKEWTAVYQLMKEVLRGNLFKEGGYRSFTCWLNDFSVKTGKGKAILWRQKKAGDVYVGFASRHPDAPRLDEVSLSPDNLELAARIADENNARLDELVMGMLEGKIKNKELKILLNENKNGRFGEKTAIQEPEKNILIARRKGIVHATIMMPEGMNDDDFVEKVRAFYEMLVNRAL